MIAFKNKRPVLQTGHCVISDYDQGWLEDVLQQAADEAGTTLPCRREIAQAVLLYLEEACPLHAVPDPYYGGQEGFDQVVQLLATATRQMASDIARAES